MLDVRARPRQRLQALELDRRAVDLADAIAAVLDAPERCVERLRSLEALGVDKLAISGATRGAAVEDAAVGRKLIVEEVLPALRR